MEDYKTATNTEKIMVFVQPGWYQPAEVQQFQQPLTRIQEVNGSVIIRLG